MGSANYTILYTDLELGDAKQIVSQLETSNIKYQLTKNGTEILVPEDMVNKMRVDMAELALGSKGSNVGYEIFDNADSLGSTNFVQNINLVRALEGELSRTIRGMDNIKSARVHLVLPKREMFSKEEQMPTASVIVKTDHGKLSAQEVQSIQKLIAAAVPKLEVKNVAIVDNLGNLLTNNYDDPEAMSTLNNELVRIEQERKMSSKIQSLLEKTLGTNKVKAQVNIEMDFDQVVTNEEIYDPDTQVVRSSSTITEESSNGNPAQPVSVAQNIPNGDTVSVGSSPFSQNSRTEETVNYEISKVVKNKVKTSGNITRLSVAVMVDGVYVNNAEGKRVYQDRSVADMERIVTLVKSAVGYNADRGDIVDVENMRFAVASVDEPLEKSEKPLLMGLTKAELLKLFESLGVGLVAILVILLVIKPLINNAFVTQGAEPRLLGSGQDDDNLLLSNFLNEENQELEELVNMNKIDGRIKVSSLKKINDIVDKNPETAVNIIRSWLYNNDNA